MSNTAAGTRDVKFRRVGKNVNYALSDVLVSAMPLRRVRDSTFPIYR